MNESEYYRIAQVEDNHFWYRAMRQSVLETIRSQRPVRNMMILDVGCGPGGMTRELGKFGQVVGIDINTIALHLARENINLLVQADVCNLPFVGEAYDLVTILDVLYNLEVVDDQKAMSEIMRLLSPGGILYLREPAFNKFRGDHDIIVKTRNRYTINEIKVKLEKVGFVVQRISYANMILSIPIYIRRVRQRLVHSRQVESDSAPLPWLLNNFFFLILHLENQLSNRVKLPFGTSVVCLARKP